MLALGLLVRVSASAWKPRRSTTCGPTAGDGPEAMAPAGAAGAEDSSASERDPGFCYTLCNPGYTLWSAWL